MAEQRFMSSELAHFVGRGCQTEHKQFNLLVNIAREGWLKPRPDYEEFLGDLTVSPPENPLSSGELLPMSCVCFCDIPPADAPFHMGKYSRFGLAFSKQFLVSRGANPVHYIAAESRTVITDLTHDTSVGWGPGAWTAETRRECALALDGTGKFRDPSTGIYWRGVHRGQWVRRNLANLGPRFRMMDASSDGLNYELTVFLGETFAFMKVFDSSAHDAD